MKEFNVKSLNELRELIDGMFNKSLKNKKQNEKLKKLIMAEPCNSKYFSDYN
jgi:hypothetical protein